MAAPATVATSEPERLPFATIAIYTVPQLGVGSLFFLIGMYFMKYGTDVLGVPAGIMGLIFGLSRVWDAISDPVAGYLSDRTRSAIGRRRTWMLASIPLLMLCAPLLWSPPAALTGTPLAVWVGVALLFSYTAVTVYGIPHEALGAELTTSYEDRNRIFGLRHVVGMGGFLIGIGALYLMETATDKRSTAFWLSIAAGLASGLLIGLAVSRLRERSDYQGRGATSFVGALRDVVRNPHARLLLIVFFIENIGTGVLMVLLPYFTAYVLRAEGQSALILLAYAGPSILLVPMWIRLASRFGKKNVWVFSMSMLTVAFGGMFFVDQGDTAMMYVLAVMAGIGGGAGAVVGPSIQADVIDYDEFQTGERKEGAYFAVWNLVRKSAVAVPAMITGFTLEAAGFVPNAEQTEEVILAIRGLMALFPGTCFLIGTLLFLRFRLNRAEHAAIRTQLDARRS